MKYFFIFFLCLISLTGISQSIVGEWKTYDDATGELKSEVEITIRNGKLYGKILKLYNLDSASKNPKCIDCTDYRKGQPILGMEIITGLTQSGKYWTGNKTLLDPEIGKIYDAKLWLENNNKLAVRGYIGWFYRTQYWIRVK